MKVIVDDILCADTNWNICLRVHINKILRLYEIGSNFEINIYKYTWIKFKLNHIILRYQWTKTISSKLNLCSITYNPKPN